MSISVTEICENTKMGREYALLGNYETSMVYYQGVLQQIQKLLLTINDQTRKNKWQQVGNLNCFYNISAANFINNSIQLCRSET